jgi:hypothetical protein
MLVAAVAALAEIQVMFGVLAAQEAVEMAGI